MSFSCGNYDFGTDRCQKLHATCIPGRPGCVLEGKVKFSEELLRRQSELKEDMNVRQRKALDKKKSRSRS